MDYTHGRLTFSERLKEELVSPEGKEQLIEQGRIRDKKDSYELARNTATKFNENSAIEGGKLNLWLSRWDGSEYVNLHRADERAIGEDAAKMLEEALALMGWEAKCRYYKTLFLRKPRIEIVYSPKISKESE